MATDENLRIQSLGLARTIYDVVRFERYAEEQGVKLPELPDVCNMGVIFDDRFYRRFPVTINEGHVGIAVHVFKGPYPKDWTLRIVMTCDKSHKSPYHREALLECVYRYNKHRDISIKIRDGAGLLRRKLGVTAEPRTYKDVRKREWEAFSLRSRTSTLDEMMKKILRLYVEQPIELISTEHYYNQMQLATA